MPFINISDRLKIHYIVSNQIGRPTVLLLHGLGANGSSWGLQIPALTEAGFRSLMPDARSFGQSSYPGGNHSIANMAEDMAKLLNELGVKSAHVVGISMGGAIALQLTIDYPYFVDKLVLVNTFAHLRPDRLSIWIYFIIRLALVHTLGLPAQARSVTKRIFPYPHQAELRQLLYDQIIQANPKGYRATMRALARFDARGRSKGIHAPTLVITGENDTTVPLKIQEALVKNIPNASQVMISNAGHAVIVDQPDKFNDALMTFLMQ
jgi:3-oxoadipate enol-lactonase